MIYLVFILGFLQIADVVTTEKILQNGKELNPVMNWLFTKFGTHNVLVLKALMVTCIGVLLNSIYPLGLSLCVALYVGVVAWNSYQLYKVK